MKTKSFKTEAPHAFVVSMVFRTPCHKLLMVSTTLVLVLVWHNNCDTEMSKNHVLFDFCNDSTSNNKKKQKIITTIEQPLRGASMELTRW